MKQKMKKKEKPTPEDIMKYEIAEELGLLEKAERLGWKSLSARESGKIGGIMSKRMKEMKKVSVSGGEINEQHV